MAAVQGDLIEERVGTGALGDKSVTTAMLARLALVLGQRGEVTWVFDLAPEVPAALMASHFLLSVEDAHERVGGDEREWLSDERVRDRVVVAIEAHVRGFA